MKKQELKQQKTFSRLAMSCYLFLNRNKIVIEKEIKLPVKAIDYSPINLN